LNKDEESEDIDAYADELFDKEMRMMNGDYSEGFTMVIFENLYDSLILIVVIKWNA